MTPRRDQKTEQMVELISSLNRYLRMDLPEEWPEVELTMPQFRTLVLLSNGPQRMSDVAASIGSSLSATTAMIDRLIEKELVMREHGKIDRRVVTCRLSPLGKATLDEFWQVQHDRVIAIANILDDEQLDAVISGLAIMNDATIQLAAVLTQEQPVDA